MSSKIGEIRKPEKLGVIFLIFKDGKILIEDRKHPEKAYFGYKIVPGGKVEDDESFNTAVKRELLEECGIRPKGMINLDTFLHMTISNHLYYTAAYLITEYDGDVINNENKADHVWVDINNAEKLLPFADSRYVLKLAKDKLISEGLIKD